MIALCSRFTPKTYLEYLRKRNEELNIRYGVKLVHSFFRAPDLTSQEGVIQLRLTHIEKLKGDVVWLCYEAVRREHHNIYLLGTTR